MATRRSSAAAPSARGTATAERQRRIQRTQDRRDAHQAGEAGGKSKAAVQAGVRRQPKKLPAQHQAKPGREEALDLAPRFEAPGYLGSGKLRGMAAIVTGGDSGIGRAVAVLFAREGCDVAIVYLDPKRERADAEATARHVEAEGRRCLLLAGDVQDLAFCRRAVKKTVDAFGRLDVLVNNAAYQQHADGIEDLTDDRIALTLHTNVLGYFHMAQAALPHLKEGASIVNTGSVTGLAGSPKLLDYSATKGAIHAFTKSLAKNLLPRGIRVNAVAPGPVWTPLNPADKEKDDVATFGHDTDMKRAAQPEELSPAFVFLASPVTAGYITGIVLPVTGSVGAI